MLISWKNVASSYKFTANTGAPDFLSPVTGLASVTRPRLDGYAEATDVNPAFELVAAGSGQSFDVFAMLGIKYDSSPTELGTPIYSLRKRGAFSLLTEALAVNDYSPGFRMAIGLYPQSIIAGSPTEVRISYDPIGFELVRSFRQIWFGKSYKNRILLGSDSKAESSATISRLPSGKIEVDSFPTNMRHSFTIPVIEYIDFERVGLNDAGFAIGELHQNPIGQEIIVLPTEGSAQRCTSVHGVIESWTRTSIARKNCFRIDFSVLSCG